MSDFLYIARKFYMAGKENRDFDTIAKEVTLELAGERVHVPSSRRFVLGARFDMSGSVQEVMRRYSVSRRTAFRIIRGK